MSAEAEVAPGRMDPMRVLVVDDESNLLLTLTANLELEGFDVVGADSAAAALDLVRAQHFDLVLTDIRMPGMSGVELFLRVKEIRPDMPVVLMTAFALEGMVEEAIRSGAFAVLSKPFDVEHVIATLTRASGKPMVLVVDDTAEHATTTAAALNACGLRAEAVFDGERALAVLKDRTVDVCVVDLVMPGMDGPAVIDRIKELDPAIAIIAVSGHSVPELMRRVAARGVKACLQKPFDPLALVSTIARERGRER